MHRAAMYIIVVIALLLAVHGAASAQTPLVYIDPEDTYSTHDALVVLGVSVSAETMSLMGYNITVTFDPSLLLLESVDEGSLPLNSGYDTFFYRLDPASVGSVHINGAILGHTVDGPGTLFTLTFRAWSPGQLAVTDVVIASCIIRDGVNQSITHTVRGGRVSIEPPIAVRPTTWGAVKALYRN